MKNAAFSFAGIKIIVKGKKNFCCKSVCMNVNAAYFCMY